MRTGLGFFASAGAAAVYPAVALDPSQADPNIVLYDGNLVASNSALTNHFASVRAGLGRASAAGGKYLFELEPISQIGTVGNEGTYYDPGIGTAAMGLDGGPGGTGSYGYNGNNGGKVSHNNIEVASNLGSFGRGDVIGMLCDFDTGHLSFAKNGVVNYTTALDPDTWYPVCAVWGNTDVSGHAYPKALCAFSGSDIRFPKNGYAAWNGEPLSQRSASYSSDCSTLDGWNNSGVTVASGQFSAGARTFAMRNLGSGYGPGSTVQFDATPLGSTPLVDFMLFCDATGAGLAFRVDARNGQNSGFLTTTGWNTFGDTSGLVLPALAGTSTIKLVTKSNDNVDVYVNGSLQLANYAMPTSAITGHCIGVLGDGGTGGSFDDISVA